MELGINHHVVFILMDMRQGAVKAVLFDPVNTARKNRSARDRPVKYCVG